MEHSDSLIPVRDSLITPQEVPLWRKGQFLKEINVDLELKGCRVESISIPPSCFINQNSDDNFKEFEDAGVIEEVGYPGEVFRSHGCGISSLYMALRVLNDEFGSRFKTVGEFTLVVLRLHRNDNVVGGIRYIGTPVFNLRAGWYHDALVYAARHFGKVDGFRVEDESLEGVGNQFGNLLAGGKKALVVASVSNVFWRRGTEPASIATHIIVINGFEFDEVGAVKAVRVTDPYVYGNPRINEWVTIDDSLKKAFTGRAIFLYI